MFIAVNKIQVPQEHREAAISGFQRALAGMQRFQGFLGLEIWTAEDGSMQAISRWSTKEALDEYLNDDLFKSHHGHGSGQRTPGQVTYYNAEVLQ